MLTSRTEPVDVELINIDKAYSHNGPLVLENFSIHIPAGDLVTVLGPSGCGKTTTLRLLAGFESPTGGDIRVGGESIVKTPASKRNMGMVFQSYSLFPNLSVTDNIEYGMEIRRVDPAARSKRSAELLEMVGLQGFGDRYPHQLSGGQQQRIALARALAIQPRVLLLDEPLSALDAAVRGNLRDEIRRVQQELGTTTLFITHDQSEALVIADHVAVMNQGKIEQYTNPYELYSHPATPFVARFIGTINEFAVPGGWNESMPIPLERHAAEGTDTIFVRPENLQIEAVEQSPAFVYNQRYVGERTSVIIEHPDAIGGTWTVSLSSQEASSFPVGTPVSLSLAGEVAMRESAREATRV
ncbi:ABC transporter ATP-binding protein [Corynebacterium casei]|uniref:ABC transporter ATP-binding protein n=1 Tax=Corynebacterium casei TaxID=160386 RepID=UPI00264998DC|nr:ABC transporter ATP-binding protein [Corynebacterium casei]MDN5728540.1 ABC transporter ATP-binding protein [Corynebacterium casei]MDN5903699.1 ABC transporter ATP-binding protein [Corynebacterium casei]MDN6130871.1 ABC transporter ATP-binding protein [Corynebacterium casei]MDN6155650.1 ABC transporter ATP-binding protein [Corynebacterium casei]